MEGVVITEPVSDGVIGAAAAGGSGSTTGSRFGGAAGWCAQATKNTPKQPRKVCRLIVDMPGPLAELILPGAQHAEHFEWFGQYLARVGLGRRAYVGFVAAQKWVHPDFQVQRAGQTGIAGRPNAAHALLVLERCAIGRLNRHGKLKIR